MLEIVLLIADTAVLAGLIIVVIMGNRRRAQGSTELQANVAAAQDAHANLIREQLARLRDSAIADNRSQREELQAAMARNSDALVKSVGEISKLHKDQLESIAQRVTGLTESNDKRLETLRATVDLRLRQLQEDNSKKLDQMRQTVDEKLHATLEKRLGESFKLVSERLELVHKGLGEMQTLAGGVGDLKKVLSNVKTRGTLAEVQLGVLLDQILAPEQFDRNVATKAGGRDRVEFAIRLPGQQDRGDQVVWLPIDAKFPKEDYQRLIDAQDRSDPDAAEQAARQLETRIRNCAKDIRDKYLDPPNTTDFAIMFLATEGLYAEVIRRPGLFERLQREFRVVVVGPATIAALLNSLQMGFQTLAIRKRSSEVWNLLAAVKGEFGKFGDILDGVQKKLQEAQGKIESAARKSRTIERKLRDVQQLPGGTDPVLPPVPDAPLVHHPGSSSQ